MIMSFEQYLDRVYGTALPEAYKKKYKESLLREYSDFSKKHEDSKYPHKRFSVMGEHFGADFGTSRKY